MSDVKVECYYHPFAVCAAEIRVIIDKKEWKFPEMCLSPTDAPEPDAIWEVDDWPEDFPKEYKQDVVDSINADIKTCSQCGGCD